MFALPVAILDNPATLLIFLYYCKLPFNVLNVHCSCQDTALFKSRINFIRVQFCLLCCVFIVKLVVLV